MVRPRTVASTMKLPYDEDERDCQEDWNGVLLADEVNDGRVAGVVRIAERKMDMFDRRLDRQSIAERRNLQFIAGV